MQNLVYIVAIEFLIVWILGFFVYKEGYFFHIFLLTAIVLIIIRAVGIKHTVR